MTIFGGRVEDVRRFLMEERLADHWEPKVRAPCGLTIGAFAPTAIRVELGVKERKPSQAAGAQAV